MSNKTLDQIRVAVALGYTNKIKKGLQGGDKIKNFPTMVQNNGLLGAIAYSCEFDNKKNIYKNEAEYSMSKALVKYINELKKEDYSVTEDKDIENPEDLAKYLSEDCTPEQFRRINAEVIAFLNYFRRFAS